MQARKTATIVSLVITLILLLAASYTTAGPPVEQREPGALEPASTTFTYQSRLTDEDTPANGSYDFQFELYKAAEGVVQVGSTVTLDDVPVTNGLFSVELDFGSDAFTGEARWLEIGVREGTSDGAYTTLTPRHALTAVPYALYALQAPWSGLADMPAGFADGVDDDTTYSAGTGLTLEATTFSANTTYLQRRVSDGCAAGNAIRVIDRDGTVTCEPDDDSGGDITRVNAGTGLTGGGESGEVSLNVSFAGSGTADTAARSNHDHWGETWSGSGEGLVLNSSDHNAIRVSGGYNGVQIDSAGNHGVRVDSAGDDGVRIASPGDDGVWVTSPGDDGIQIDAAVSRGVYITSPGHTGVRVENAANIGVSIATTGDDGVRVESAGQYGVYADTTDTYGFYTPDKIYAGNGYDDIAEHIDAPPNVEPSDVVVIDPDHDERVVKSTKPYDTSVAGIISTDPALLIGKSDTETPLALAGRVPCKVSAENGAVHRGDLLTTSSTPGHAMKATDPQLGTIVGKALGELQSGTGVIQVLVTLQ